MVLIVVIVVALGGGVYYYSLNVHPSSTSTSTTSAQPMPTSLVAEETNQPDHIDPAVTYQTPGWEIVEQVYQGLVAPDGTSVTTYVGVLAQNWTVTPDGMNYTFLLRKGVTFSNGDPFNAYVMWFSIYRTLDMNQAPAWILGQNLALTGGAVNVTAGVLNSINYFNPSSENVTYMSNPDQSVQAVNPYELVFHLGYGYNGVAPYSAFLATLTTPMAMAVDPAVIEANGGVVDGQTNNWMETHALGTGFYELQSWVQGQSITLVKNPNYWADNISQSELNDAIQPAYLQTITIYYKPASSMIADITSNAAQMILAPSSQYAALTKISGVNTTILPPAFGSSEGTYYLYMDPLAFAPFQTLQVREAIADAVDYQGIIHTVFNGLANQWIGPVPLGFPFYNESIAGLQPYQYNPTQAAELLAQAGYIATLPNGTTINPTGKAFPSVNFLYNLDSATQGQVAQIIQSDLHSVGINIQLTGLTYRSYSAATSSTAVNSTSYPFGLNYYSEDYTASIDYVSALTVQPPYVGTSGYANQTVVGWVTNAATALDDSTIISNFQQITRAMYYNYDDVWLYVPDFIATQQRNVVGMIPNPAGSGMGYFMFYNTIHYT